MKLKVRYLTKYLDVFELLVKLYLNEEHKPGYIKFKNGYYYLYEVVEDEEER